MSDALRDARTHVVDRTNASGRRLTRCGLVECAGLVFEHAPPGEVPGCELCALVAGGLELRVAIGALAAPVVEAD